MSAALVGGMILHSDPCSALYAPPAFYQLAAGSELVVLGQIVALSDATFSLFVEEVLVGACSDSVLTIARFQDWTCSLRWQPYAIGQREIAFLCRTSAGYRTNSPGAEGEWEVIGDQVKCAYLDLRRIHPHVNNLSKVLPLEAVISALKDFGACVRIEAEWKHGSSDYKEVIVESCDSEELDDIATRSKIHKYLVETMRAAKAVPYPGRIQCSFYRGRESVPAAGN